MKVYIELPFFPGFYESDLENGDTSYWAIKEELEYYQNEYAYNNPDEQAIYSQLTEDDLDFNYEDYEKDVRDAWVESFRSRVPDFVLSVEDAKMVSPKYYNYDTDRVYAHYDAAAADMEAFSRPLWGLVPVWADTGENMEDNGISSGFADIYKETCLYLTVTGKNESTKIFSENLNGCHPGETKEYSIEIPKTTGKVYIYAVYAGKKIYFANEPVSTDGKILLGEITE